MGFKAEKMPSLSTFMAGESKSNLTFLPHFIRNVLISLNKPGNYFNCHTNLLLSSPHYKVIQMKCHYLYYDFSLTEGLFYCNTSTKHSA